MRYLNAICFTIILPFLVACSEQRVREHDHDAVENLDDEEIEEFDPSISEAPADQVQALTAVVPVDSTDLDRSYRYHGNYIYISKPKMRLYVLNGRDSVLYSCGIACGIRRGDKREKGDYRTPEGHFTVSGIFDSTEWLHRTRSGNLVKGCYGPFFLRLATGRFSGIGIHGTNSPGSIGKRASEGCVRVNTRNIIAIKEHFAYNGMPVIISGEHERLPQFAGLGQEISSAEDLTASKHADSVSVAKAPIDTLATHSDDTPLPDPSHAHPDSQPVDTASISRPA